MKSDTIHWCMKQQKGIRLVDPNVTISEHYLQEARNDCLAMAKTDGKWRIVTAYYSCYNALYAILVNTGIKCEIHDCTIALMHMIGFNATEHKFMERLKQERINVQYYLKSVHMDVDNNNVMQFLNHCTTIIKTMDDDKINTIHAQLKKRGVKL